MHHGNRILVGNIVPNEVVIPVVYLGGDVLVELYV